VGGEGDQRLVRQVTLEDDAVSLNGAAIRAAFRSQAGHCARLGSPFTARLCSVIGERLDHRTEIGRRMLDWPGNPDATHDALPLRLAGGLHALVRNGQADALAKIYPPHSPGGDDDLWTRIALTLEHSGPTLMAWLDSPPQTNEVRRAALLMAGLACVASITGLPAALYELGSSAGLNLVLDRYAYVLGGRAYGPAGAAVKLAPDWIGPPPPDASIQIASRRGVDLRPLDVNQAQDRERLLAYIWADQSERLARTAAAIEIARHDPPTVDAGDAADWTEARLAESPGDGVARVLMHTIAFQYFNPSSQARIVRALDATGATATAGWPLAWLRFELPEAGGKAELRLTLWPGGVERRLAVGDAHGAAVEWLAA
jgi:hypothetical protein